jgi:hypothetical protein
VAARGEGREKETTSGGETRGRGGAGRAGGVEVGGGEWVPRIGVEERFPL